MTLATTGPKTLANDMLSEPAAQPVPQLAETIEKQGNFDLIVSIGGLAEGKALAAALVGEMWQFEGFGASLNGHRFLELWPHILRAEMTGAFSNDDVVRLACSQPTFVTELCSDTFATNRISMYSAVLSALSATEEATRLADWVATSLSQLTRDQWQMVTNDSDWVGLLSAVHEVVPSASISGAYAQGLGRLLEHIATTADVDTSVAGQWDNSIVPLIASAIKPAYVEEVARVAVGGGGALTPPFFDLVGETLADPGFLSRPDVLNGLLPNLVTERNLAGLSWLVDALTIEGALRDVPENGLGPLAAVVPTSFGQNEETDERLRRIAALIGLELEPETEE